MEFGDKVRVINPNSDHFNRVGHVKSKDNTRVIPRYDVELTIDGVWVAYNFYANELRPVVEKSEPDPTVDIDPIRDPIFKRAAVEITHSEPFPAGTTVKIVKAGSEFDDTVGIVVDLKNPTVGVTGVKIIKFNNPYVNRFATVDLEEIDPQVYEELTEKIKTVIKPLPGEPVAPDPIVKGDTVKIVNPNSDYFNKTGEVTIVAFEGNVLKYEVKMVINGRTYHHMMSADQFQVVADKPQVIGPLTIAKPETPSVDMVNHSPHYTSHPSGVECIEVTRHMSFNLGNAIKYLWRSDSKGAQIQDLEKAVFYIQDEIKRLSDETV